MIDAKDAIEKAVASELGRLVSVMFSNMAGGMPHDDALKRFKNGLAILDGVYKSTAVAVKDMLT